MPLRSIEGCFDTSDVLQRNLFFLRKFSPPFSLLVENSDAIYDNMLLAGLGHRHARESVDKDI